MTVTVEAQIDNSHYSYVTVGFRILDDDHDNKERVWIAGINRSRLTRATVVESFQRLAHDHSVVTQADHKRVVREVLRALSL